MTDPAAELLQKRYELACNEEGTQFDRYLKSITFYIGLISALLSATVAGALQAKPGAQTLLLLVGPMLTLTAAYLGRLSTRRLYRNWLEKITIRAKFEQALGLTHPRGGADGYWKGEPIIAARHIKSRSDRATSAEFVDENVKGGYNLPTRVLFFASAGIALCLILGLGVIAFTTWP